MAFASNLAAMNAAKALTKANGFDASAYKEYFKIEKVDGEWHSLMIQPFVVRDPLNCLLIETEGAYQFPTFESNQEARALFNEALQLDVDAQDESEEEEAHANRLKAADALADSQQATSALPNGKVWIHISSVAKPTKFVWEVANSMVAAAIAAGKPLPTRKAVQDECIRLGVASGTARTQYQAWKKASDNTLANAKLAEELSRKFNQSKTD